MSRSNSDEQTVSLADVHDLCRQAAASAALQANGFRPSTAHVCFFTCARLIKQKVSLDDNGRRLVIRGGNTLTTSEVSNHVHAITEHLGEWGPVVTALKNGEDHDWELLRIQMERSIRRYSCPQETKDDALQSALVKVWTMLQDLPDSALLEECTNVPAFVKEVPTSGLYDFGSPFYAYAKRIARNELIDILRREGRDNILPTALDDFAEVLEDPSESGRLRYEQTTHSDAMLQLRVDLQQLLVHVQTQLTTKQRQTVLLTLAARSQFWRAVTELDLAPPEGMMPVPDTTTDTELAQILDTSENSLRVHRSQARKRIDQFDSILGALLDRLLAAR